MIVSTLFALNSKSLAVAGETGVADTVSVTFSLVAPLNVAVTVLLPPSSEIDVGPNASVTVGVVSSSVMVSVCPDGLRRFDGPAVTLAVTLTVLSDPWIASFAAVILTVPVLEVCPFAMVSVVLLLRVKSDASVPAPGTAATFSVTSSLAARFNRAVTVLTPLFSEIVSGDRSSIAVGPEGPSRMCMTVVAGSPTTTPSGRLVVSKLSSTLSPGSTTSSARASNFRPANRLPAYILKEEPGP